MRILKLRFNLNSSLRELLCTMGKPDERLSDLEVCCFSLRISSFVKISTKILKNNCFEKNKLKKNSQIDENQMRKL